MSDETEELSPEHTNDVITDSNAIAELMLLDSDDDTEDDVISAASFNASRLANRKYKNKDRPNYFICFKVVRYSIGQYVICVDSHGI